MFWTSTQLIFYLSTKGKWVGRKGACISHGGQVFCQHARVHRKTMVTAHVNGEAKHELLPYVARTHCVLPKQNPMYLRQFLFLKNKKQKTNFVHISRENSRYLKKVFYQEKHSAGLLLLTPHSPLQTRFTHTHGNYKNGQKLTIRVKWERLAIDSPKIQPFIHHMFIKCLSSAKHMLGTG